MNSIRTIYLYIVCFITLGMVVSGIASVVNNIASYYYPDSYVFFENKYDNYVYDYSEEEENEIEKENFKNERIKNAIVSGAVIIIGGIMYKYHWKIIERERNK